jgi:deazaflavin-dependent oxidoreductase (nitroreductase family)
MPTRYSVARGRRLTAYEVALERFAASPAGAWLFIHAVNRVDRHLLAVSRGRLSLALGAPVGLLQTTGARTGQTRRAPLLYLRDGDDIVLIASNGGRRQHPAWVHNLRHDPEVWFLCADHGWRRYRARIESGPRRSERWAQALDLYAGYRSYQRRTHGREIPVVVLHPVPTESQDASGHVVAATPRR